VDQLKYKAFLSYSHRDERWAKWLHKSLEAYRPPKALVAEHVGSGSIPKRLSPVFRDREELPSATDLGAVISEALSQSACQIIICSPNAARSRWVNEEILAFKRLGREGRIFCLIVDGEPNASDIPGQSEQECFPNALRFRIGADGELSQQRSEPIAADAREGKDGKNNALLKLIAGMLGVGFDALKRREQHRYHRRMALTATAAFGGMVITTGLAGAALIARENEQRERIRAEAEAETARQTTSFLIDLFRISDPGEARGNTITAREMLDKGAARIETELADQPNVQATLMDTVGAVYMNLGLYAQAQPLLDGALGRRQELLKPTDPQLAESLNHVGELLRLRAEYQRSEVTYRSALAHRGPDSESQRMTAVSLVGLAEALSGQGRFDEAERSLREALEIQKHLHGESHSDVAHTTEALAVAIFQRGDLQSARPLMDQAVAMQRRLRGDQPHPDFAQALNNLMFILHAAGEYRQAEQLLSDSIEMKRRLLGEKHPELALGMNNLASMMQDRGEYAGAEAMYGSALAMQRELLGDAHPDVATTLSNMATLLYDKGDHAAALRSAQESLQIFRAVFTGDHPEVAGAMHTIGYWLVLQGSYDAAADNLDAALAMRRRLFGDNHVQVAASLTHVAMLQVARRQYAEALLSAREATKTFSANLPPGQWRTAIAESVEGAALAGLGDLKQAETVLLKSYATLTADSGTWPIYKQQASAYLHQLYARMKRPSEAQRYAALIPRTRVPEE
jgi:tetratricopeptide (TPR) repeat protein